jgi:hypothetical protein
MKRVINNENLAIKSKTVPGAESSTVLKGDKDAKSIRPKARTHSKVQSPLRRRPPPFDLKIALSKLQRIFCPTPHWALFPP